MHVRWGGPLFASLVSKQPLRPSLRSRSGKAQIDAALRKQAQTGCVLRDSWPAGPEMPKVPNGLRATKKVMAYQSTGLCGTRARRQLPCASRVRMSLSAGILACGAWEGQTMPLRREIHRNECAVFHRRLEANVRLIPHSRASVSSASWILVRASPSKLWPSSVLDIRRGEPVRPSLLRPDPRVLDVWKNVVFVASILRWS